MDREQLLQVIQELYNLLEDSTDEKKCYQAWELCESVLLQNKSDEEQ
jgi:hypothetical protein